jgi:hypothetical protein
MKMKSSWGSAIERNIQSPRPTDAKVADARAPLFESSGCYELDADMTRMTPMIAAAGCSCSSATTEIQTAEHSQPRGLPRPVKRPDPAINTEKPQQPR